MNLNEYFKEYRALTLDIMDEIQKNGNVISLIEEREKIINEINNGDFDKEEIKMIVNSLGLLKLEEELQVMYKKEKVKVKKQIENVKRARKVNDNYNNIGNVARVLNKSV